MEATASTVTLLVAAVVGLALLAGGAALIAGVRAIRRREDARRAHFAAYLGRPAEYLPRYGHAGSDRHGDRAYYFRIAPQPPFNQNCCTVWIENANNGQFNVRRERRGDTLGKRLGLVSEVQTGDASFDRHYFVDTAEPAFAARFLVDAARRQAIAEVLDAGFERIVVDARRIAAETRRPRAAGLDRARLPVNALVERLALLGTGQPDLPQHLGRERRVAWRLRLAAIYTLIGIVAALGFAATLHGGEAYTPLQASALFRYSLNFALPALALWLLIAGVVIRGHSSSLRHLLAVSAAGVVALPLAAYGLLIEYNGRADVSPSRTHQARVLERQYRGGRAGPQYHAMLASWRPGREQERIVVRKSDYDALGGAADRMQVETRDGALGFEWVVGARLISPRADGRPAPP